MNKSNINVYPQPHCSCRLGGGENNANDQYDESRQNDIGDINDENDTSADEGVRQEEAGDNGSQQNVGAQVIDGNQCSRLIRISSL